MSENSWTTDQMRNLHDQRFGRYFRPRFDRWLAQHDAEVAKAERERLAKAVWEEKQKVFDATTKDPTNSKLLAYQSGLWRALDIIEGGEG